MCLLPLNINSNVLSRYPFSNHLLHMAKLLQFSLLNLLTNSAFKNCLSQSCFSHSNRTPWTTLPSLLGGQVIISFPGPYLVLIPETLVQSQVSLLVWEIFFLQLWRRSGLGCYLKLCGAGSTRRNDQQLWPDPEPTTEGTSPPTPVSWRRCYQDA